MAHRQEELIDAIYDLLVAESNVTDIVPAKRIFKWLPIWLYNNQPVKPFINIKPQSNDMNRESGWERKVQENIEIVLVYDAQASKPPLALFTGYEEIEAVIRNNNRPTVLLGDTALLMELGTTFDEDSDSQTKLSVTTAGYDYRQNKT
jgi:hypothetical protein